MRTSMRCRAVLWALAACAASAAAQNVKITPLGSHAGELCARDRATIFEDPTGVRLLYDAGHSVTGTDDSRLGTIHAVLLSHAHGDHIGDSKMKAPGAGTCDRPETVPAGPNSTTADIAAAKNAAIVMVVNLAVFIGKKIEGITGKPVANCPQTGGTTSVPVATPCRANMHLGGMQVIKAAGAEQGVEIHHCLRGACEQSAVERAGRGREKEPCGERVEHRAGAADRLRHQVHQRTDGLPVGRHRHTHRDEDGGA